MSDRRAAAPAPIAIAVHGGAGRHAPETLAQEAEDRAAVEQAVAAGHALLAAGGSALDAVCAAVTELEDCPLFNAGRGSVLNEEGVAEMDAAAMCGRARRAGAVACVRGTRNPILAARAVLDDGRQVLLAGEGADRFAREAGVEVAPPSYFVTDRQRARWELSAAVDRGEGRFGTVGAVARDAAGHLAAATSTGGVLRKRTGRVGDTPLIGAGTWADDATCAISCTGAGEPLILAVAAYEIHARVTHGAAPLAGACERLIAELGAEAGLIALGPSGAPLLPFNTPAMHRAWRLGDEPVTSAVLAAAADPL